MKMEHFCIILALPEALARYLLSSWVELYHVALLDSVFCDSRLRPVFATLAFSSLVRYPVHVLQRNMLAWYFKGLEKGSEIHVAMGSGEEGHSADALRNQNV